MQLNRLHLLTCSTCTCSIAAGWKAGHEYTSKWRVPSAATRLNTTQCPTSNTSVFLGHDWLNNAHSLTSKWLTPSGADWLKLGHLTTRTFRVPSAAIRLNWVQSTIVN